MMQLKKSPLTALCGLALVAGLAGCDGVFDVNNPNNVLQEDLERPTSMNAVLNGTADRIANADAAMQRSLALISDETQWIGSLNDRGDLHFGNINFRSNDVSTLFNDYAEARWLADEAVRLASEFDQAGTLQNRQQLATAHFYRGLAYTRIAELYDDFVIGSDRTTPAPPVGPQNMPGLFDEAINSLTQALSIGTGAEFQRQVLAARARAHYLKDLRGRLTNTADPLVSSAEARADAEAVLATGPGAEWRFAWEFSGGTGQNTFGNDVNSRLEQRFSDVYVTPTADGRRVESVTFQDPITGSVDPVLQRTITAFVAAGNFPEMVVVSARELRLIVAEVALATGDQAGFTSQINALRALDGLAPYAGQIPAVDMLHHSRRTNLFIQGKRLHDQYRFGARTPAWLDNSDAVTRPGTLFPIGFLETVSNCHLAGGC